MPSDRYPVAHQGRRCACGWSSRTDRQQLFAAAASTQPSSHRCNNRGGEEQHHQAQAAAQAAAGPSYDENWQAHRQLLAQTCDPAATLCPVQQILENRHAGAFLLRPAAHILMTSSTQKGPGRVSTVPTTGDPMTAHRVPVLAVREGAIIRVADASDDQPRGIGGALIVSKAYTGMPAGADLMVADRLSHHANAHLVAEAIADAAIGDVDSLRDSDGVTLLVVDEEDRAHVVYFASGQTEIDVLDDIATDFDMAEAE